MSQPATRVAKIKDLLSRLRSVFGRQAIVLFGLVFFAALPALIDIEWFDSDSESLAPSQDAGVTLFSDSGDGLDWQDESTREFSGGEVEWDSQADVESADANDAEEFDCMIEPWEKISVRSPVIGRIDAIHAERADAIKVGDLLVELDADLAKAELDVATKRADMTASIRALKARHLLGTKRGERAKELFSRNALALDAKDEILTEKEISNFDVLDALDQHSLAILQLARERARYAQRRIRSPIDGIVANRLMSVGQVVDEETVLEIAQIDPLRVEVILPAIEFGNIRRGMKAAVIPEIPGDEVVVATVLLVDKIIDSASGTFGVELELPNSNHEIPGGLRCRVQFMDGASESEELALAVPDEQIPVEPDDPIEPTDP